MQKPLAMFLLFCLLLPGAATGCTAREPAEPESAQNEPVEETLIEDGIVVTGTVVEAAGKRLDMAEKNDYIRSIARCRWIDGNKVAIESRLNGTKSQDLYLVVYDVVRDLFVYEQYGKQFIWQNNDLDTLIYVVDYADEEEPSQVCNKKEVVLYETSAQEQITNISYVPKGIKVEVVDLHGESLRQVVVEVAS